MLVKLKIYIFGRQSERCGAKFSVRNVDALSRVQEDDKDELVKVETFFGVPN